MIVLAYLIKKDERSFNKARNEIRSWARKNDVKIKRWFYDEPVKSRKKSPHLPPYTMKGIIDMLMDCSKAYKVWTHVVTPSGFDFSEYCGRLDVRGELEGLGVDVISTDDEIERPVIEEVQLSQEEILASNVHSLVMAGPCPFGFKRDHYIVHEFTKIRGVYVEHPREGPILKEIFRLYRSIKSINKVREILKDTGVKTRRRKAWSSYALSFMFRNKKYIGVLEDEARGIYMEGVFPALVDRETFEEVGKILSKNCRLKFKGRKVKC